MARRISTTASAHSPSEESILRFDDAPEFSVGYAEEEAGDDMEQQVREAQHRLAALRSQQEEVERQKLILETLRHKQERFVAGKKEITDKLDRALRIIADELDDANRRAEDLSVTQQDFQERLEELKTFLPERWQRGQLDHELDRALGSLDEAETSYEKGVRRLMVHRRAEPASNPSHASMTTDDVTGAGKVLFASSKDDFMVWLRRGIAFNAALIATLILVLILAKLIF